MKDKGRHSLGRALGGFITRLLYLLLFASALGWARENEWTVGMVYALLAGGIGFFPPTQWNEKIRLDYWMALAIGVMGLVILVVVFSLADTGQA